MLDAELFCFTQTDPLEVVMVHQAAWKHLKLSHCAARSKSNVSDPGGSVFKLRPGSESLIDISIRVQPGILSYQKSTIYDNF